MMFTGFGRFTWVEAPFLCGYGYIYRTRLLAPSGADYAATILRYDGLHSWEIADGRGGFVDSIGREVDSLEECKAQAWDELCRRGWHGATP